MDLNNRFLSNLHMTSAVTLIRISLGIVLLVGGWKLAFPADPAGLVEMYVDTESGFIAPLFVEWIEGYFGLEVLGFLNMMGWIEMSVGLFLVAGFVSPFASAIAGLLFFSFAISNPSSGMIRLAQDITMGGFAFAIAYTGTGRLSIDGRTGWFPEALPERRDWLFGVIRVSLIYAFVMALLFPFGVGMNPLNQTLPWIIVLILAIALLPQKTARISCGAIALWMAVLVLISIGQTVAAEGFSGLYWGLDSAKRELGLFAGSLAYALAGKDGISFFPPGKFGK